MDEPLQNWQFHFRRDETGNYFSIIGLYYDYFEIEEKTHRIIPILDEIKSEIDEEIVKEYMKNGGYYEETAFLIQFFEKEIKIERNDTYDGPIILDKENYYEDHSFYEILETLNTTVPELIIRFH